MQVSCESRAHRENDSGNRTLGVRLGHLTMLSLALTCYNRNNHSPARAKDVGNMSLEPSGLIIPVRPSSTFIISWLPISLPPFLELARPRAM